MKLRGSARKMPGAPHLIRALTDLKLGISRATESHDRIRGLNVFQPLEMRSILSTQRSIKRAITCAVRFAPIDRAIR